LQGHAVNLALISSKRINSRIHTPRRIVHGIVVRTMPKMRSSSGSFSGARSLGSSRWNTIFKAPRGGEGDGLQKSSVSRSKLDHQADVFHGSDDQMALRGVLSRATPRILSNRTILTLSYRHPIIGRIAESVSENVGYLLEGNPPSLAGIVIACHFSSRTGARD
jgi:hypothetical protein